LDPEEIDRLADQARSVCRLGVELAVVIGGGNLIRGAELSRFGINRVTADHMGMISTVINGLALQDALERKEVETRVMTAINMHDVAEPYIRRRCLRHLEKGRIVILAGGTGNPHFTTDTTAALRAAEIGAEVLMKATKVDGVYSGDPLKEPSAKRYEKLTYLEVLNERLQVMDATAISMCMEKELPILVFSLKVSGNVLKAICGEPVGTYVGSGSRRKKGHVQQRS
jgi:uridylate kinase